MSRSTLARHLAVRRLADPAANHLPVHPPDVDGAVPDGGGADGPPRPPRLPAPRSGRWPGGRVARAWHRLRDDDAGMSTVEYAIGCVAAAAFAAVLYGIVSGESVVTALTQLVQRALSTEF